MNECWNGPHGECSEQMYKLYQLLKAKGITMHNHFIPSSGFFFDYDGIRFNVRDEEDGNGIRLDYTKRIERKQLSPYRVVEVATARAVLD